MRWRIVWAIPWLLGALSAVLLTRASTAQDGNLLTNGGFENGTDGWLAISGELSVDDALVHGGSFAGVFVTPTSIPGTEAEVSQCLPVEPSTDYEFRGYASRPEGEPFTLDLRVTWYDESDCFGERVTGDRQAAALGDPGQWYELMVSARSGANARAARLRVVVEETDATIYLDDFAVSSRVAPTETPTAEPSASPTLTATPRPPIPSPSATPDMSPTASSWYRTPVPVQSVLRNSGFEEADPDGLPSFWRQYGGELIRTDEQHFEGQFAAALSTKTSSVKWAYQLVTVQGGRAYLLSAHALKADPAVAAVFLRLSWYDNREGSGEAVDSVDSTAVLADDSPEFRLLTTGPVVAPAKAASAKVRLMLAPAGQARGTVYFDAVTFEETALPQPSPSPTATPSVMVAEQTAAPASPAVAEPTSTAPDEVDTAPTPSASATVPQWSPAGPSAAGKPTPAALAAVRAPATTATAAATAGAHAPPSVFRQHKADLSVGDEASARAEGDESGLPLSLLALAAGIPALAGAGAGVYYWRWRRARLR